jgi:MFS superfamily sulfate permease-like transporter
VDSVLESVLKRLDAIGAQAVRLVVCDLSASPYIDLAGSRMLHELQKNLSARGILLRVVGAHGWVRDLLRADGFGDKVGGIDRTLTLDRLLASETK